MKEKISIMVGIGIAALVLISIILFILKGVPMDVSDVIMLIIPLIIVIGVIYVLRDRFINARAGLPTADERLKKVHWKAGAYSYYATIWIAIGTMWYNIIFADNLGFPLLDAGQVVATIVLSSSILWFFLQIYFQTKGDI